MSHPLRLLIEHTNYAKHRLPAITTTRLAAVTVVDRVTGGVTMEKRPRPIAIGDVVAESKNVPSAIARERYRASHAIARSGLTDLLLNRTAKPEEPAIRSWVETLDPHATLKRFERLQAAADRGRGEEAARQVIRLATRAASVVSGT